MKIRILSLTLELIDIPLLRVGADYFQLRPGTADRVKMPVGIVTESSSVVAQIRVDSGYSIANGGVVSRSPTLSLITRKFARQSHAVFSESRNAVFIGFEGASVWVRFPSPAPLLGNTRQRRATGLGSTR